MIGIVLAGGNGSRLSPSTDAISKQLLPIYNKPMIYYPLSVLMMADIKDIIIISTPDHLPLYKGLLGDGSQFGLSLQYVIQPKPAGIAEAFKLTRHLVGDSNVSLILGDNLFIGQGFQQILAEAKQKLDGAYTFLYQVNNPKAFGVATLDNRGKITTLEEKPKKPRSNFAVTGLYMYSNDVFNKCEQLLPSDRNELEITDVNKLFLNDGRLDAKILGRGFAWLDTGTPDGLLQASSFVATLENQQNTKIACLEEIGLAQGWLSKNKLNEDLKQKPKSNYYQYLRLLVKGINDV